MSDPIIDRLDQIKDRADAATPGPWSFFKDTRLDGMPVYRIGSNETGEDIGSVPRYRHSDGGERHVELITAARTDVPQMEQALRAVLATLDEWRPTDQCTDDLPCVDCVFHAELYKAIASALGVETEGEEK